MTMKKLKDGIDNVVVHFDKDDVTYKTGSALTGHILVICEETTAVREIRLKIFGRMSIYWRKTEGGSNVEYAEIEDYLDEDLCVWSVNPKKRDEMWMFPGEHTYPFHFDLPIDLPDTLEDSRYAKVTYHVRGSVLLTQQRVSNSLDEPFYIITAPDPSVPKPTEEDLPKENCEYAVIGGTCLKKKTFVELYLSLERNTYKLGEQIPVHIEINSEGGNNEIQKVTALLVQEAIYCVNPGCKEEAKKKERLVMSEAIDHENSSVGRVTSYDLVLDIDERMPLTDYPWCDFIEMAYFVHVVARTHSFYDDVVVKLPLIINPKDDDHVAITAPDQVIIENEDKDEDNEDKDGQKEDGDEQQKEDGDEDKDKYRSPKLEEKMKLFSATGVEMFT